MAVAARGDGSLMPDGAHMIPMTLSEGAGDGVIYDWQVELYRTSPPAGRPRAGELRRSAGGQSD